MSIREYKPNAEKIVQWALKEHFFFGRFEIDGFKIRPAKFAVVNDKQAEGRYYLVVLNHSGRLKDVTPKTRRKVLDLQEIYEIHPARIWGIKVDGFQIQMLNGDRIKILAKQSDRWIEHIKNPYQPLTLEL